MKLIILDFDGTLADTAAGITATMAHTFRHCGLPPRTESDIRQTIGLPLDLSIARLARLPQGPQLDRAVATYRRLFESIGVQATALFPHVTETLDRLRDAGTTLAIATSRGHASVESLCRRLGIAACISHYVAEEDVPHKKPAPDAVLQLLEKTGATPNEALVVGDTTFDILMGRAAGCPTCAVTYGNHSREQLTAAGADHLIDDFAELPGL